MKTHTRNSDNLLLLRAIEKFTATTGVAIQIVEREYPIAPGRRLDALANIDTGTDEHPYAVEVKRHLSKAKLGLVAETLKVAPHKGMLVTASVHPPMAERLRELDIAFIDLAGNAYLNEPPIFIYVKGNRPPERKTLGAELKPIRAFQPTGIKMLFGLLVNPKLLNRNYRDIADATGVALGAVAGVFADLRQLGYLVEREKGDRHLIRKRQLLDQWITASPEKLRPKLKLGRYQADDPTWWMGVNIVDYNALWGAEVAAARMTQYLQPQLATISAHPIPPRLLLDNRLKKAPDGNVELLKQFWHPEVMANAEPAPHQNRDLVPAILTYADLIATAEDRNIETAKLIHDEYLHRHIGSN